MAKNNGDFAGLRVASFESRRQEDMARLIERLGGVPHVSPSMREVPLEHNPQAADFANRLLTGQFDLVIFMTGVGFRHLLKAVEKSVDRQRFLDALSDTATMTRGPKPVAAMKEVGLSPTYKVPEPNTWRELLATCDEHVHLANQHVAMQEYGIANASLVAGLEARGAKVYTVKVYNWELPEDCRPMEENIRALASGERDVVMFTSANQVANVLRVAEKLRLEDPFREQLHNTVVASIGPTTSEMLRESEILVDLEPEHPKMGSLVAEAAAKSGEILERKRRTSAVVASVAPPAPVVERPADAGPWYDSIFMRACRREPVETTPVWLMRQAGRYMQEYREIREKVSFLELCENPQLCSEVMCTAVQRLGVDAAIIFSDLLPILQPMGLKLEFVAGDGPVIHNPIREPEDIDRLLELESVDELHFVIETVRQTRSDLPDDLPLIGFAGAPFTLASYAIEGGSSRNYLYTKSLMYRDEGAWHALMQRFARGIGLYLNAQVAAGAQAVQIFDSWAGCLSAGDYREFVLPYVRQIIDGLPPGVPVINFATGNPALNSQLAEAFAPSDGKRPRPGTLPVIGVDWRQQLDDAWREVGHDCAIQGNLDPAILLADRGTVRRSVRELLQLVAGRPGHIFNLGHGVLQQTPVDNAIALVDAVHEFGAG